MFPEYHRLGGGPEFYLQQSEWRRIIIATVLTFLCSVENNMLNVGEWPYMQEVKRNLKSFPFRIRIRFLGTKIWNEVSCKFSIFENDFQQDSITGRSRNNSRRMHLLSLR